MTTISSMAPVSVPRFAPSSQSNGAPQSSNHSTDWGSSQDGQNADLDFDLLAEYLLDDAAPMGYTSGGIPQFDFSEANSGSGVVSPEISEDGFPPISHSTPAPAPLNSTYSYTHSHAPPQQTVLAPAPPPQMAAQGMSVPHFSGIPMSQPGSFPPLPAQVTATSPHVPNMMLQQHAAPPPAPPKRRRVDAPTKGAASATLVPHAQLLNGQLMAHVAMANRGRQKSQAQIDRRRERNRILARRTRLRKKFFFESLQKEVTDLQRENLILKELVKSKLKPEVSKQILSKCDAMEKLPSSLQEAIGEGTDIDGQDFNLIRSIQRSQQCFVISDPSLQDNPIVYASDDFLNLTGYQREEVLGRNCRFLQGTGTCAKKVEQIRKSISMGEDVTMTMINYTADGTAFWNKLFVAALRDAQNNIVNFIGVIVKVAAPDPDDPEAGKRLPGEHAAQDDDDMDDDDDGDDGDGTGSRSLDQSAAVIA